MAWIKSGDPTAVGGLGFGDTCCSSVLFLSCLLFRSLMRFFSRELCVRVLCISGAEQVITMQVVYFKTDTSLPVGLICTPDGKIDFSPLGLKFGWDPSSIAFNGIFFPSTGLQWQQLEEYFKQEGKPVGTEEDPVIITGQAPVSTAPPTGFNRRYKVDGVRGWSSEGINARRNSYFSERSATILPLCDLVSEMGALLIRAPPGSGKTSILQLVGQLNDQKGMFEEVYYISLAQIGKKTFDDFFEEKYPGVTIAKLQSPQSSPDKHPNSNLNSSPSLLLVDEGQVAFGRDLTLWNTVKDCAGGFVKHLRIIIVSAWGSDEVSHNGQHVATPVVFKPEATVGLLPSSAISISLRFTTEEAISFWTSWCNVGLGFHGDLASWDGLKDYVFILTGQQPGLMAHVFDFLIEQGLKNSLAGSVEQMNKARELLLSHKFYDSLSQIRSLMKIGQVVRGAASDGDSMRSLSRMLLGVEGVHLRNLIGDVREAADSAIKWGQIIVEGGWLRLPSDLHKQFLSREVYRSNETTFESITEGGLYRFIDRVIERLDPRQLEKSKARNAKKTKLYESQFQNEFYRAARSILPADSYMSPNVGPLFGSTGYIDYYLHPQQWGFELLVDGSNLKEHKARFEPQGVYHKLIEDGVISEYAILDFRTKPRELPSVDVLHIVFSEDFGKATLHRVGSVQYSLDIGGSI